MGIFGKPGENKPAEPPARVATVPAAASLPGAAKATTTTPTTTCVIGAKTTIKGEISGDEEILVEGTIEGQVRINKDLRVGQGGVVKATVDAQSVVVSGELIGDCHAAHRVEIQSTGRLTGNIRAPRVVIAEGAVFKGNSDMTARKG